MRAEHWDLLYQVFLRFGSACCGEHWNWKNILPIVWMQLGTLPVLAAPSCLVPFKTTTNFEGNARSFKRHGYSSTFPSPRSGLRSIPLILHDIAVAAIFSSGIAQTPSLPMAILRSGFRVVKHTGNFVRRTSFGRPSSANLHQPLVTGESSMMDPHWHWCLESESNPAKQSKWHWKHSKLKCWS